MSITKKLKSLNKIIKQEITIYKLVLQDKRTPRIGKFFLGLAVGYALLPFDLIPDFIPVLGYLDDLIILPVLFYIALKLIPKEIVKEHRIKVKGIQNTKVL